MRDAIPLGTLPDIRSLGPMVMDPVWAQRRHASAGSCELIHILRGRVRVELRRGLIRGGPGDTLLIPSNTLHRDEFDAVQGLHVFMVFFAWAGERPFLRRLPPEAIPARCAPASAELGRAFDRLQRRVPPATDTAILLLMLDTALGAPRRPASSAGVRRRRQLIVQAREYLDAHYREPVTLEHIARVLRVSPCYLSHVFSQDSEFSLFAYLTSVRMARARALLETGRMSVKEAAAQAGYRDEHYFSKVFRRHVGCAPRDTAGLRPRGAG